MAMNIGICEWRIPLQGTEKETQIQWVATQGLEGVELDLGDESNGYRLSLYEVQRQYDEWRYRWKINYPSLGVGDLCRYGMSVSSHQKMAKNLIKKAIDTAVSLKIPIVQLPSFVNGSINSTEGFYNTVECLQFACKYAEGTKILIGNENILSVKEQISMIEEVGYTSFRICFDTRNHFRMKKIDVPSLLERLFPYVCEVHLKDGINDEKWTGLGQGNSGFLRSIEVLKNRSYNGWLLLENDYGAISKEANIMVEEAVRKDIDIVSSLIKQIR